MERKKQSKKIHRIRRLRNKRAFVKYLEYKCKLAYGRGLVEAMPRAIRMAKRDAEVKSKQLYYEQRLRKIMSDRNQDIAKTLNVTVKDPAEMDIVADVQWVYDNLGRLFVYMNDGRTKMLNPNVLKQARSNGAIAFCNYALDDLHAFFDKFVVLLFKQQVERKKITARQEDMDWEDLQDEQDVDLEKAKQELDPALDELSNFFGDIQNG